MHLYRVANALSLLSGSILSVPFAAAQPTSINARQPPLPVKIIHEFPAGTNVENLAVRQNGKVLVTLDTSPEIYQIDPSQAEAPKLVSNSFGPVVGLLGIVETCPDVFYVAAGNSSFTTLRGTLGSWSVWKVDLTTNQSPAPTSKVADIPNGQLLNGMALLSKDKGLVLVADSDAGVVWRLNVFTGEVLPILNDPLLGPPGPPELYFGVNGIKIRDEFLYFTNTGSDTLYRLPVHSDGTAAGSSEVVLSNLYGADDFQFNNEGDALVALFTAGELWKVSSSGMETLLVGNSTLTLPNPTAVQFGRRDADRNHLYISEAGNATRGGRLSVVDVGSGY